MHKGKTFLFYKNTNSCDFSIKRAKLWTALAVRCKSLQSCQYETLLNVCRSAVNHTRIFEELVLK